MVQSDQLYIVLLIIGQLLKLTDDLILQYLCLHTSCQLPNAHGCGSPDQRHLIGTQSEERLFEKSLVLGEMAVGCWDEGACGQSAREPLVLAQVEDEGGEVLLDLTNGHLLGNQSETFGCLFSDMAFLSSA